MQQTYKNGYKIVLVEEEPLLDKMTSYLFTKSDLTVGIDTETTGLDYLTDHMVGLCISFGSPQVGYYIPVRHIQGINLPIEKVIKLTQVALDRHKTIWFNRNFDFHFLEKEGLKISFNANYHDAQVMAWEATQQPFPSLKNCVKDWLKFKDVLMFEDVSKDHNFANVVPTQAYLYASLDALFTVLVASYCWKTFPYIKRIYPIDNKVTEVVRRISKNEIFLDFPYLKRELLKEELKLQENLNSIFKFVGYRFNPNSNRDKQEALSRFVTLTVKTKKGTGFSVGEKVLENVDHPLAKMLVDHSKRQKYISSYLRTLIEHEGKSLRINISPNNVPSGRFSTGKSIHNSYFMYFNIQSTPKIELEMFIHPHPSLGYCLTDQEEGSIGKAKTKAGIRKAFLPRPGDVWMTADFKSEELCLAANFAQEETWAKAIREGGDPHAETCKAVYGVYDPLRRTEMKALNFAVLYGGNEYTLSKHLKKPVNECKSMMEQYFKMLPKIKKWIEFNHKNARAKGICYTYYGRPRLLSQYYNSSIPNDHGYADRTSCNHPCQGSDPASVFIEYQDLCANLSYFEQTHKQYLPQLDGREASPSHRGMSDIYAIYSTTGDFIVCDYNHSLLLADGVHVVHLFPNWNINLKVKLAPLHKKLRFSFSDRYLWIKNRFNGLSKLLAFIKVHNVVHRTSINVWGTYLFWAWLKREKVSCDEFQAASLRSVCGMFGYNLVAYKGIYFKLKWRRRKSTKLIHYTYLGKRSITALTMYSGFQYYQAMGFINKNTGGDILRIVLIRMERWFEAHPEDRDRMYFLSTIHDEFNFSVRPDSVKYAYEWIKKIMYINHENWIAPLTCDVGFSPTDWGSCLDVIGVTDDNKLVINPKWLNQT